LEREKNGTESRTQEKTEWLLISFTAGGTHDGILSSCRGCGSGGRVLLEKNIVNWYLLPDAVFKTLCIVVMLWYFFIRKNL
jgi:hypothetical protein